MSNVLVIFAAAEKPPVPEQEKPAAVPIFTLPCAAKVTEKNIKFAPKLIARVFVPSETKTDTEILNPFKFNVPAVKVVGELVVVALVVKSLSNDHSPPTPLNTTSQIHEIKLDLIVWLVVAANVSTPVSPRNSVLEVTDILPYIVRVPLIPVLNAGAYVDTVRFKQVPPGNIVIV
jgi:hypothetical protein